MSENKYTEVTTQGWLSRLGEAFKGILFGLILFIIAFPLLFWNEGRAVDRIKAFDEGAGAVVHIESDQVNQQYNNKLVHLTDKATTNEILEDGVFNVSANALKLKREVQIYQWKESVSTKTEKQLGGSEKTTKEYSYSKVWDTRLIDSTGFKQTQYQNPSSIPYQSNTLQAREVTFGGFDFPDSLLQRVMNYKDMNIKGNSNISSLLGRAAQPYSGGYYIGENPASPKIGDLKINFQVIEPLVVSIVAQQYGNTFQPYAAKSGSRIMLLEYGPVSAESMFQIARESNVFLTWFLRILGLILMAAGLGMVLGPLSVIADVVPVFGNIVEAGTGLIAFLIALVLSVFTIAFAWLFYRPLVGIALLAVACAIIWLLKNKIQAVANKPASKQA